MATEERNPEMLQYLREHVAYERTMLGYTYARLHDTVPGIAWNVVYESFRHPCPQSLSLPPQ